MEASDVSYEKKVFATINWFDFVFSQEIAYKKKDLRKYFFSLYIDCLGYIIENEKDKIEPAVRDYILSKIKDTQNNSENTQLDSEICIKNLKKHILFGNKTDYRYLLFSEVLYSAEICNLSISDAYKNKIRQKLLFTDKEFQNVLLLVKNPEAISDTRVSKSFLRLNKFLDELENYNMLKVVNIGVCATMSAGKSSFVNALLGYDYLPMRTESTTARITSVYDNDNSSKLIGYTMKAKNILSLKDKLDSKSVDEWNSDDNIDRIILQGDLDNISNNGVIVAVHDTPGTNNSGDRNHHDITLDFLKNNKMDAIIFVANIEHLCTTDEADLLKELYEKVIVTQNIPVIFVLNKADSIDSEKETFDTVLTYYKDHAKELGFTNSSFIPISSKAARLLKMAIKNKSNLFTESEYDTFPLVVQKFTKRLNLNDGDEIPKSDDQEITIDGEIYKKEELITALFHTGINRIETEIETIVKR